MHHPDVQRQISELDKVRSQLRLWRTLLSVGFLVVTLGSIAIISKAAHDLFSPGAVQEEFTSTLTANLQKDVVPAIQSKAAQTLTEMRPQIEQSFTQLNSRVPEVSQASLQQIDTLQKNVTTNSAKTLNDTLGKMLGDKESKIKEMFPDVTDDKIKSALQSVGQEAQDRLLHAHDAMLSPHTNALDSIMSHLSQIQATERINPQTDKADWELGITLLDLVQSQAKDAQPSATSGSSSSTGNAASSAPKPNLSQPASVPGKMSQASTKPKTTKPAGKETANGTQSSGY